MGRATQLAALVVLLALLAMPASALASCWTMTAMGGCHSTCAASMPAMSAQAPCCCVVQKAPVPQTAESLLPVTMTAVVVPDAPQVFATPTVPDAAPAGNPLPPAPTRSPHALLCTFLI